MTSRQNGGHRSPSGRSRQRSRTRSYDSYYSDDYSDSFDSESERDLKKASSKESSKKRSSGTGNKKPVNSRPKNAKPGSKGKGNKNAKGSGAVSPRDLDVVAKRMLSARRLKINELQNQIVELNALADELRTENRSMKQEARKQGRKLDRYEEQEGELPSMISRHIEEVRSLKDQIRRFKEKYDNSSKRYRDLDEEFQRTKRELKKIRGIAENKKLGERDELARKLTQSEIDCEEKDRKIKELEKYIDNLQKNQRHELAIEIHRHKDTQRRVEQFETMVHRLENQIREKEKELEIKNIYCQRIVRPPHKLPSGTSTPLSSIRHRKKSSYSDHGMTPREKVRQYEERRREEERKLRELLEDSGTPPVPSPFNLSPGFYMVNPQLVSQSVSNSSTQTSPPPSVEPEEDLKSSSPSTSPTPSLSSGEESERDQKKTELIKRNLEYSSRNSLRHEDGEEPARDSNEWQYKKDKERWDTEEEEKRQRLEEEKERERKNREALEMERMMQKEQWEREKAEEEARSRTREDEERRQREERERQEREDRERREKEDRARREREEREMREREENLRREREELERFEREERERREREEAERRAQEERERLDQDTKFQEERRKKDLLLARLKALDQADDDDTNMFKQNKQSPNASSKKGYSFTKPIENMHQGKPAHDDVSVPYLERMRRTSDDDGYQPSFSDSRRGSVKDKKKADLMKNLFGDSGISSSRSQSSKREADKPEVEDLSDEDYFVTKANGRPSKDIDLSFNFTSNKNKNDNEAKLLPRRPSQQPTTITKPTVNAVDEPDDLEEVIL